MVYQCLTIHGGLAGEAYYTELEVRGYSVTFTLMPLRFRGGRLGNMQIFIPALWIAAGISLYAGLQFVIFGVLRRQQQVYLAFGVLCLILAMYILLSPQWYRAETVPELAQVARYQMGLICLIYPVFIWFANLYTLRKAVTRFLVGVSLVSVSYTHLTLPTKRIV